jgi:hypothetical protein
MERHKRGKVVGIKDVIDDRAVAEERQKTVVRQKEPAGFDPAYAAHVYAHVSTNDQQTIHSQKRAQREYAGKRDGTIAV